MFQGVGLFPHMTVAENIAITPRLLGWDEARIAARVDELLDLVRLERAEHRDRLPAQLSGGERQRVGVARAIAAQPKIVLMDEPFGALDPLTRDALGEDYRRLHDELGLTTVMITHDTLEAVLLADRIAVIRDGRIVADGTPRELMTAPQDDYVRELMATPRRQADRLGAVLDRPERGAMNPQIADAFARLPAYLGGHVAVSVTALVLGLAISLPLALASMRRPALRNVLLAVASVVQTIPGLALLALFYPLLLGVAALSERVFGAGFSALGFLPSVLALTLYSMLPVLRNTIAGLDGVDADVKEAALGVGMTPRQSLFMVELPLALPVIMAGIRTAAVWVIGTATLSTPIGQTSLGNYIFTGLQTQNWVFVLFGCVAAAVFALAVDQLLALMESGLGARRRARVAAGALGLVLLTAAALAPGLSQPGADLRDRHQDLHRAIHPGRADRAAAARRRPLGAAARGPGLERHLRRAARRRDRRLCRLLRHDLDQPDAAHRREAARRGAGRDRHRAARAPRHRDARRARLRERLCAGDGARPRAGARHPQHRRSRAATRRNCRSPATTNSSPGRNGRRSARPMASRSASSARCSRSSCTPRRRPARST